jgi:molybdopterin synthase catalytic subunit
MFKIVRHPIDLPGLLRLVGDEEAGAIATFVGVVRRQNAGKRVMAVEYEAYPAMAEKVLSRIGEEVARSFGPLRMVVEHRVGRLEVGEASVAIVVSAAHRREALAAVSYAIERVKQVAPIWKKEWYEDGTAWLENPSGAPGPE